MKNYKALIGGILVLVAFRVSAEQPVLPLPTDSRLVQFVYDPNNTYTILARPGDITAIQIGSDEQVVAMALGDTLRWITAKAPGFIFVKPSDKELVTSATLVTNKRSYQLTLRAGPMDGRFYQRVSWSYPDSIVISEDVPPLAPMPPSGLAQTQSKQSQKPTGETPSDTTGTSLPTEAVNLEKLNFNYTVTGKAEFKPEQVFDDGKFTWIKLSDSVQSFPAVFVVPSEKGSAQVPNFTVKGRFIVIHRKSYQTILRLGEEEVRITQKKSFWGD